MTEGKAGIGAPMYFRGASGPGSATGPKARAISSALGCEVSMMTPDGFCLSVPGSFVMMEALKPSPSAT